jgi:hypothetical protein
MSIKFQSPLGLSAHRAIAHSDSAQTLTVKVVTKTAAHPEYGNGSSSGYIIDNVEGAYIELTPGNTYKFDQSDSSNNGHPLRLYEDAAKTTAYTTGVTTNGTPGTSGAYTQIIPTVSTPPILFYQCSAHSLMGSYIKFGTGSQGDTYTLSATQDGDNVDILLDAGSGTDSTVQLTAGNNITLTRSSAQEIEIASSGGGGGTVTVEKNVYTGDGSDTTFNTSTAIVNENNVQVYIDGVYQSKDNYTTSGSTVTFSTAPPNTTSVELIHMVAVDGVIARDGFTGNGSTTAFVLSMSITNENATQVYIDGVYQSKDNYTTSGSTLTFSTAPPNSAAVEVVHIKAVDASSLNQNSFTGNGSTTAFTLSQSVDNENKTFVFIQGIYQEKSMYSISGNTITFSTAPQNGYTVEVMAFSTITIGNENLVTSVNGQTGDVTVSGGTDWQSTIKTADFTAVAGNGYLVNTTSAAITVTLPSSPSAGDELTIVDYAGTADTNNITITSSDNINGSSGDVSIDYERGGVSMVYVDATQGWIAYNAANETATALANPILNFSADYLVVAGGGGGGGVTSPARGGGGGAGGLRTSYGTTTGGGGSAESSLSLFTATNYTVTVGTGGSTGTQGNNSVFSTITSTGGGFGGAYNITPAKVGGTGGSGGGSGADAGNNSSLRGLAVTSPVVQGYDGGYGLVASGCDGGGGGGAGSVGGNGELRTATGGVGGDGLAVNILNSTNAGTASVGEISGSDVYYAGGAGGGSDSSAVGRRAGGIGGGGAGGSGPTGVNYGDAGDPNTGGGGGAGGEGGTPANGGSGVVILRYPSAYSITVGSGITEASGSPFTEGSDKVSVFTGGTGNISFS